MTIFDRLKTHYTKQKPFVCYRKPNASEVRGLFMSSDVFYTDDFTQEGFIFAPFDEREKSIFFPKEAATYCEEEYVKGDFIFRTEMLSNVQYDAKREHIRLVNKTIDAVKSSDFEKIVVSRKEVVSLDDFELTLLFNRLLDRYENAFVYVWYHPKVGLWLGATPETLLTLKNKQFSTMSLAGTKKANEGSQWTHKELKEQEMVTDYILEQLNDVSGSIQVADVKTVQAGFLHHLKTEISGMLDRDFDLEALIRALHPTPAICGLPAKSAKEFILHNESYHRSYYAGFLGECKFIKADEDVTESAIYVNLRCMSIENNQASIYVGGGITEESDANLEWEETVSKSKIMKAIL